MALSPDDHLKRAKYNEDFARFLKDKWPAWSVTAYFYAALHYAQAVLVKAGKVPQGHKERNKELKQWPDLRRPYMRLYQYAHDARYLCRDPSATALGHAKTLLADVKTEAAKELGQKLP